jgi:hypothetical protein
MACPSPELAELIVQQMREVDEFVRASRLQRTTFLALEEWRPWLWLPDEADFSRGLGTSCTRPAKHLSPLDTLTSEAAPPHLWGKKGVAVERGLPMSEVQRPASERVVRRCLLSRVVRRLLRAGP